MNVLEKLKDERIVSFELVSNKLYLEEECDQCFVTELSKLEVEELIDELKKFHSQMIDEIELINP